MIFKLHALHHMCIITMFHAFSMCVLLCVLLCVGRFGLGWAHDEFIFACHMFMHSHAYVLYILYIFIYLNCFGTFLSVSFPPFFLLRQLNHGT